MKSPQLKTRQSLALVVVLMVAALASGCTESHLPPHTASARVVHAVNAAIRRPPAPEGVSSIATMNGAVPGSPEPGAAPNMVVPSTWYGYPSILPVIGSAPDWVEVRLAQRPNGSTTWVPRDDVSISSTPYQLILDLATEHLAVYEYGKVVMDFPAGTGAPDDPTVTGNFFVAMQVPPPDAGYGPFVLVTSAHSDAIADWEGSGDAIIAIHGPITAYDDQLIGTTGAAISHGCIRLHNADLAQLDVIPPGTPLEIISGAA